MTCLQSPKKVPIVPTDLRAHFSLAQEEIGAEFYNPAQNKERKKFFATR